MAQGRVGHTHNRQDACFSHVASTLNRAQVLEDREGFRHQILQHLPDYHVELLHAAEDFKQWLLPLGSRMAGINQTAAAGKKNLEAIHCWKLVRRELLPEAWRQRIVTPDFLSAVPQDEKDVILLPKLYMASPDLSQAPLLFISFEHVAKLAPRPQNPPIPRVMFSQRQRAEFLKTAELMKQWGLNRAWAYLKDLASWLISVDVPIASNCFNALPTLRPPYHSMV